MKADLSRLEPGTILPTIKFGPIQRHHLVEWCAVENDYYNIHYDEQVAASLGFKGVPIQGTYKIGLIGQFVKMVVGGQGQIVKIAAKYRHPDCSGSVLHLGGVVTAKRNEISDTYFDFEVWIKGDSGKHSVIADTTIRKAL